MTALHLRKYSVRDSAFSEINKQSSYWAGFIAADGSIFKRKNSTTKQLQLSISYKDLRHLQVFKTWIEFQGPIKRTQTVSNFGSSDSVRVAITSSQIVDDLKKNFCIGNRKSQTLPFPKFKNRQYLLAFIKGYLDGNGCILLAPKIKGSNKLYFEICSGSKKFVAGLKLFLDKHFPSDRLANITKDRTAFRFRCGGIRALSILASLYSSCSYGMKRKWDFFIQNKKVKNDDN